MNRISRPGLTTILASALLAGAADAAVIPPSFSVDPASPAIDGAITPDDVLAPGPAVFIAGTSLGLVDAFGAGFFDVLNALSYGKDPVPRPGTTIPLFFSVDRVAVGLPGTAVDGESFPGAEASGDVFTSLPPVGDNVQHVDEAAFGLTPGFFGDDVDALELDTTPTPFTYFSIDSLSATNGFGAGGFADDILVSDGGGTFDIFADGVGDITLLPGDDLDALVLLDRGRIGVLDPGLDLALFSLSTFSPSAHTFTGLPYSAGIRDHLSPADVLFTDFLTTFHGDQLYTAWAPAAAIGLLETDEVNALDTVLPEPPTYLLLGAALAALWATTRRRTSDS